MNPFIYEEFWSDMIDAVDQFIRDTKFYISNVDESSITLRDNGFILSFYLDGVSMVATIESKSAKFEESFFEFFTQRGVGDKYPFDKENKFTYREWNKYMVKTILMILMSDLKECIEKENKWVECHKI